MGRIQPQHLQSPLRLVCDALPGRLRGGPQFEVSRSKVSQGSGGSVVQPISVDVMHALVWKQRSTKQLRHFQTMFCNGRLAVRHPPEFERNGDDEVTGVVHVTSAGDLT